MLSGHLDINPSNITPFKNLLSAHAQTAEIQTFAQFLPTEWRYRRRISREALTRLGWSSNFITQLPKEGLLKTLDTLFQQFDWEKLFRKNSILCDLGLIDRTRFFEGVDIYKKTLNENISLRLGMALKLELSLQSAFSH